MRSTDVNGESEGFFKKDDLIYVYSREQAIEDGDLVDVSKMAREAGIIYPVAITRAAWNDFVAWSEEDSARQVYQEESGRLWDVLWMLRMAIRGLRTRAQGANSSESEIFFDFCRVPRGGRATQPRRTKAKAVCAPIGPDDPRACITIMLTSED